MSPRVTVITIFLNEERFLEEAIESVLAQTYNDWELLLCDDGSTDRSADIAREYAGRFPDKIRYLHHDGHRNLGMSATRNLGIRHARSELISWLDADDVWTTNKLERQVEILDGNPEAAMVYGPLHIWYGWTGKPEDTRRDFVQDLGVSADSLVQPPELLTKFLLNDMHTPSGVLVRRAVLEEVGGYDESFRGMHEDGVVHAKICLRWPVYASGESWYKYRQRPDSCCNLSISAGTDQEALSAYLEWLTRYLEEEGMRDTQVGRTVDRLLKANGKTSSRRIAARMRSGTKKLMRVAREIGDRTIPQRIRSWVGLIGFGRRASPPSGWLHLGNLRRTTPISRVFGFDRGTPIDRYYIERFLQHHMSDIHGHVLEVGDPDYTIRFGGDRVEQSDVLHARPGNPSTTIVGDLCTGQNIPENKYDCIIMTQVLPFVWDFNAALTNARRALRPGGVLLLTVPGISQISRFDADRWGDFWRFTSYSMRRLIGTHFSSDQSVMEVSGNALAATAFIQGIAAEELRPKELEHRDPDYEIIITVRIVKAGDHPLETK